MNVLVTERSGFIGRNIVKKLKGQGYYVVTLDLKDQTSNSDTYVIGDVRDLKLIIKITKNMDFVLHLAAVTSPPEFENLNVMK
ncbi:MAG: NAD-dependent epimerase/dehydratase family protein [Candidatus Micrarchaeaceae archaeon]|nr:NAD-dependent epimerase/dehydratase family protein [Candidatus Rehaiarchaeum fermentans]